MRIEVGYEGFERRESPIRQLPTETLAAHETLVARGTLSNDRMAPTSRRFPGGRDPRSPLSGTSPYRR